MDASTLVPAARLAAENPVRFPGESAAYRTARMALLAEEIELRRHIERVAEMRRALPQGPIVANTYRFMTEDGRETDLAGLFGEHSTLVAYSYMFGPQAEAPCPMCTNHLGGWDGNAADIQQRTALAAIARSPIERLVEWKKRRGWRDLKLYSDLDGTYSRDWFGVLEDGREIPALNVFSRNGGEIRLFWAAEMADSTADPGQDARGAPDPAPLWTVLDMTPEGRPPTWYPSLDYPSR